MAACWPASLCWQEPSCLPLCPRTAPSHGLTDPVHLLLLSLLKSPQGGRCDPAWTWHLEPVHPVSRCNVRNGEKRFFVGKNPGEGGWYGVADNTSSTYGKSSPQRDAYILNRNFCIIFPASFIVSITVSTECSNTKEGLTLKAVSTCMAT